MKRLEINLFPIKSPGISSAKLWIRDGSRADPIGKKGIHQLLCSLFSRGCGPYSNKQLAEIIEGNGASFRSEAYEDGLLLSLKCISNNLLDLLPLIGWMIYEPHIDKAQLDLEKELSIQSLNRQKENPFHIAFDSWRHLAYEGEGYEYDALGSIDDIRSISSEDILPLSQGIKSRGKVLVIGGSIPSNFDEEFNKIEPFTYLKESNIHPIDINSSECEYQRVQNQKDRVVFKYENTKQVVILLGKPTVPHGHIDDLALRLLCCYLGCGMSCLLFRTLREKYGVAYEVGAYHPARERNSPFLLHAATSEEKASLTLNLLKECWSRVVEEELTIAELELVKTKYKGQIAHSFESISQRTERQAHLRGLNLPYIHDELTLNRLNSINSRDIKEASQRHLQKPFLSLCGPRVAIEKLSGQWKESLKD